MINQLEIDKAFYKSIEQTRRKEYKGESDQAKTAL